MNTKDFIHINVPGRLANYEKPSDIRLRNLTLAYTLTEVMFLTDAGLLRAEAKVHSQRHEDVVIRLSDLTSEGQDFIMSGAIDSWLGACDRKSNRMLADGATEEERLAVYRDPKGLYKRLEKFRKERKSKLN
jgi:hypothetical protein